MGEVVNLKEAGEQSAEKAKLKKAMQTVLETTHLMGAAAIVHPSERPAGFKEMMEQAEKKYGREWLTGVIQEFLDEQEAVREAPEEESAEQVKAA